MDADNTDGIINKLVMVFALCPCYCDRSVIACTATAPIPAFNHC